MKFGKALQQSRVPEWAAGYINYKALKKLVAAALARKKQLGVQTLPEDDPPRAAFFAALDAEVSKVCDFFVAQQEQTMGRCHEISALQRAIAAQGQPLSATQEVPDDATLVGSPSPQSAEFQEAREAEEDNEAALEHVDDQALLDEALDLKGELDELMDFQHVNLEGFRKILKKFDKRLKEQTLASFTAAKITPAPLSDRSVLRSIEQSVDEVVKIAHANVENRKVRAKEWKTYEF